MTVHILSCNIIFLSFKNSISSTVESQTNGLHIFWQVELISNTVKLGFKELFGHHKKVA